MKNLNEDGSQTKEPKVYKISVKKNPRYFILLLSMVGLLISDIVLYLVLKNIFFIIAAAIMALLFAYIIYILRSAMTNEIALYDDHLSYKQSKNENETIYYKDISLAGVYADFAKMYRDSKEKFAVEDGFYIFSKKLDKYLLIGVGFDDSKELFKNLKESCEKYGVKYKDIQKRKKFTIIDELRELLKTDI